MKTSIINGSEVSRLSVAIQKSVSERITDSVAEKQKINQQIMQIELKLSLLRTRKGNMQESEYQKQMSELISQRAKLKRLSSIN
ncbi:hypothetical protein DMA51_23430 [Salmonella enterica subsp. enterica]|nr:hypothetical protein [Salmonella enterica subsp. enterica serovar Bareilly]